MCYSAVRIPRLAASSGLMAGADLLAALGCQTADTCRHESSELSLFLDSKGSKALETAPLVLVLLPSLHSNSSPHLKTSEESS